MRITLIGHSTVLLEMGGQRVLTDPYFGRRGNPAYARLTPPARRRDELQDVDLVLVSHNHWDHTDRRYFRGLPETVPVLAPHGASWVTRLKGASNAAGIRPWDQRRFGALTVTAVPALHLARTVGYVVGDGERQVYFAGDTYHRPFLAEIGRRFDLDVALMPVTTYRIPMTMGEKGAVEAARDLGAPVVMPIHLGIQPRSPLLRTGQSPQGFARRLGEAGLAAEVVLLGEGESWTAGSTSRESASGAGDPGAPKP
jgi:L-ascorbate metabolism protein UlaG (beta-lactamase superfamily)